MVPISHGHTPANEANKLGMKESTPNTHGAYWLTLGDPLWWTCTAANTQLEVPAAAQEVLRAGHSGLLHHHEGALCQALHGLAEKWRASKAGYVWWHPPGRGRCCWCLIWSPCSPTSLEDTCRLGRFFGHDLAVCLVERRQVQDVWFRPNVWFAHLLSPAVAQLL